MRRTALVVVAAVLLLGCDKQDKQGDVAAVLLPGCDGGGGDPCPGACPEGMPTLDEPCDVPDTAECRYLNGQDYPGCVYVYACEHPTNRWYDKGRDGNCSDCGANCDPGDVRLDWDDDCPPDVSCYRVDTHCMHEINFTCADTSPPEHSNCPPDQPDDGALCSDHGKKCHYPLGDGCFTTMACDGTWSWIGEGCEGSGGNGGSGGSGGSGG